MSNENDNIVARLALADAILASVKESGLAKPKRRRATTKRRRRSATATAKPRAPRTPKAPRTKAPLANVPEAANG